VEIAAATAPHIIDRLKPLNRIRSIRMSFSRLAALGWTACAPIEN
jgi:hypothetical protein